MTNQILPAKQNEVAVHRENGTAIPVHHWRSEEHRLTAYALFDGAFQRLDNEVYEYRYAGKIEAQIGQGANGSAVISLWRDEAFLCSLGIPGCDPANVNLEQAF